jgi:hypothetical protein
VFASWSRCLHSGVSGFGGWEVVIEVIWQFNIYIQLG